MNKQEEFDLYYTQMKQALLLQGKSKGMIKAYLGHLRKANGHLEVRFSELTPVLLRNPLGAEAILGRGKNSLFSGKVKFSFLDIET
jgi:hypothetical protein